MIKLLSVTLKNFISVGAVTQSIDLNQSQLTLILGENLDQINTGNGARNGCGKSTKAHAISYALFGQALSNIKKDNLVNKINSKNMLVTLSFEKNGINYRIERGRKPAIFKFYINNELKEDDNESQGESRETQKSIDELLCMNHMMYKNIVSLNTYSDPFLAMKAADQREIIENLLGVTILSDKAEILKTHIKETKDSITKEQSYIEATTQANNRIQESINKLIIMQSNWAIDKDKQCNDIARNIIRLNEIDIESELKNHELLQQYQETQATLFNLNKQKLTLESTLIQSDNAVKKFELDITKLSDNKCPTCEQGLHTETHLSLLTTCKANLYNATEYLNDIGEQLNSLYIEINNYGTVGTKPVTIYPTLTAALSHQNNLKTWESRLESKFNEDDPYQQQIDALKSTALTEISWDSINELTRFKEHQDYLLKLLTNKDSFVRKQIIDQNLSYLNGRLSHYLEKIGLQHLVTFHNDLSVQITYFGHDLDFFNLSRGEMTRLTLSLSFAFRDVWENLYQPINLTIVDELLDSGMDIVGAENAVNILQTMIYERNKNIFLISHKEELISKVNNVLKAVKESGFTSYSFNE